MKFGYYHKQSYVRFIFPLLHLYTSSLLAYRRNVLKMIVSPYEIYSNTFWGRIKMQFVFFYTTVIASLPQGWILYKKKSISWNCWVWQYIWIIRIMLDTNAKIVLKLCKESVFLSFYFSFFFVVFEIYF